MGSGVTAYGSAGIVMVTAPIRATRVCRSSCADRGGAGAGGAVGLPSQRRLRRVLTEPEQPTHRGRGDEREGHDRGRTRPATGNAVARDVGSTASLRSVVWSVQAEPSHQRKLRSARRVGAGGIGIPTRSRRLSHVPDCNAGMQPAG